MGLPAHSLRNPEDNLLKKWIKLQFVTDETEEFHFILKSFRPPFKTEVH